MKMDRKEMLHQLGKIKALTVNLVAIYDVGIQFDVMTSKGVCTNIGNVGNWPCCKMPLTPNLKLIKSRLSIGENVSNEEILKDDVCRKLLTYTDMFQGESWLINGDKLENCIKILKDAVISLNTDEKFFFAYVDLENWGDNDIVFFKGYNELIEYFGLKFGSEEELYEDMDEKQLKRAYEVAKENDWNGVPFKNYVEVEE